MSKQCPIYGKAIYVDCQQCDDKPCKTGSVMKLKHGIRLKKGDMISIGNLYYIYVGKNNGCRVLFNVNENKEIEVGDRFFCRFNEVKVN